MKKYYIIGGQYAAYCHGSASTLTGAKRIATRHAEHWDNWQGWHVPKIYNATDVTEVVNFYGSQFAPKEGAFPVAVARYTPSGRVVWTDKYTQTF